MYAQQKEHIEAVLQVALHGVEAQPHLACDPHILQSWQRCVHQHRLDPTRLQEAVIVPAGQLRAHRDSMEEFLRIARHGLEALYQQVAGLGYCVLLADARGVTVDFLGDLAVEPGLRKAGLYLGSDWNEAVAGTNGVGTCMSTGEALTVHLGDHFDVTHMPLTCSTAPIYDAQGQLTAVLDISALSAPQPKPSQHLALQLVKVYANHVDSANFLHRFREDWILKLSTTPHFLDVNPEYLLALDSTGRVIGHNRRAQQLLQVPGRGPVVGMAFEQLFQASLGTLGRFMPPRPTHERSIRLQGAGTQLYLSATPPPVHHSIAPLAARRPAPPRALAALSGGDAALDRQIARAAKLVHAQMNILLTGETGSGKEYFAKALHADSPRSAKPFVAVNCAAIPESLIESELFGHVAGSFSGAAAKGKRGLIQEADTGTLFLDEIGDMPRELQARLLRVLAEREVLPVGATRPVPVDIRVIAATHCDLEALVRERRFRDDLYYRLNGAHLALPPLRQRQDFDWVVQRMLAGAVGDGPALALAPDAAACLRRHAWPGNLRELKNAIDFAATVCCGPLIQRDDLPEFVLHAPECSDADLPPASTPALQKAAFEQQLQAADWNLSALARQLGVARMTLYRRMQRHGITPRRTPPH